MPLLKISGGDISVTLSLPNCGSTTCVRLLMPLGKIFETLNGAQSPSLLLNTYKETFFRCFRSETQQAKSDLFHLNCLWDIRKVDFIMGHSGDFGNAAKMVGKMSKSGMQLISIRF